MFALPECNFQMTLFFMNYFDKIRTEILKSNGEKNFETIVCPNFIFIVI